MAKRLAMLMAGLFLVLGGALAQTHVSGTVVNSEDDEPVIGASVIVDGTNVGAVTDVDGKFEFTIPQGASTKVTVSYIGMVSQSLQGRENMKVTLKPDQHNLDEVMVVAYGTAKKSAYTGAASEIKADKIENRLTSNISQALTGTMAGVQSYQTNGQPGTSATIRIRGISSINGVTSPLYVVDGVPYDGDLSALNPNDIEKMTVLKDAVSTSLYGSRGANGVVMITTKQGQQGRARITVDAKWGANSREVPNYDVIGRPGTYYEKLYETLYNGYTLNNHMSADAAWQLANQNLVSQTGYQIYTVPDGQTLIGRNGKLNPLAKLGYNNGSNYFIPDDWEDETFKTTLRQEYNVNVSGATDKINYYASFGYLDDDGTIKGSGFKRLSTRTNVEYKARKWLTIGSNVAFTHTNSYSPEDQTSDDATSSMNAFYVANNIAPIYPIFVRDAQGNIMYDNTTGKRIYDYGDAAYTSNTRNFMSMSNPLSDLQYNTQEYLMDILDGNWFAKADLTHGFTLTARIGLHTDNTRLHYSTNPKYGQTASYGGENIQEELHQNAFTHQYLLNYDNAFGKNNINLTAGFEGYRYKDETFYADGQNLYKMGDYTVGNTIDQRRGSGEAHEYNTAGFFFNGSYNWDERYFVNFGYRRDGTSAFSKDNRWGDFFSIGFGWNMKKESWLRNVDWIDLLKIRGSFGQTGNDNHEQSLHHYSYYAYEDIYKMTGANGVFSDGSLAYKGNPNLKWEKTNALDFGADYSFWNGRLTGSLDYYFRATSNLLDYQRVAASNGYSSIPVNMGTVQNYGFEFEANYGIFRNKDFKWDVSLNMTFQKNKIHKLSGDYENGQYVNGSRIYKEGQSIYNLYLVHYEGVDPETGMALYTGVKTDGNGQPVKDETGNYTYESTTNWNNAFNYARRSTSSLLPDMFGGLGTSLAWKGFDFSIQTSFQLGGDIFDSGYQSLMDTSNGFTAGQNWHKDILKSWTPTNTHTDVPRADNVDNYANSTSDRFLISSDYFSIDNITLGYTLPKSVTAKIGIEALRVYFAADNVALFSARQGLDPRLGIVSASTSFYTSRRSLTGGIKLTF